MLILAGLGNPGPKFEKNRHNVGFMALDAIADRYGVSPWRSKFQGLVCEAGIKTDGGVVRAALIKPQTFYNESGRAIGEMMRFFKSTPDDVIVFYDEIDLAPGRFRMKKGGGAAGNNGVRSTTAQIGDGFRRARIGTGHPGDKELVHGHVLSDFHKADKVWLEPLIEALVDALPFAAMGDDERYQAEVLRLAPSAKADPRKLAREGE